MRNALFTVMLLFCITCSFSQKISYRLVKMDSTYEKVTDSAVVNYLNVLRPLYKAQMDVVIGKCEKDLNTYAPQSELSNLLTDMLYQRGNEYSLKTAGIPADLSVLNFGGIRTSLFQGAIKIEHIFNISPFDNTMVIIELKGSELQKMFDKFSAKHNEPYANAQVTYQNDKVASVLVNGTKIDKEKTYRLVTIDFIATGGDNILTGVSLDNITYTGLVLRDLIIEYVKAQGTVTSSLDERVIIK